MLEVGNTRRCQSPTQANAQSSRSHAVFQIIVQQRDKSVGISADFKTGKLSLIDLAGSERASRTKVRLSGLSSRYLLTSCVYLEQGTTISRRS